MYTLIQDVRYGIRMMMKNRGFTFTIVLILAIGIGANVAIFSIVDKLLVRSLPVKNPQELVFIHSISVNPYFDSDGFAHSRYEDFRKQNNVFSDMAAIGQQKVELSHNDRMERIWGEYVTGNYFDMLGISPAMGRAFSKDEGKIPGNYPVVIVSEKLWKQKFNSDLNLLGKSIKINDQLFTVIGIAPKRFSGVYVDEPADVWMPLAIHPRLNQNHSDNKKRAMVILPAFPILARIKNGITFSQAEAGMDITAQNIEKANKKSREEAGIPFEEQHIKLENAARGESSLRDRFSLSLKLLTAAVAMVLLIACINIAGLLIARGFAKRKEMAIRVSIGASRLGLIRQMLIESLLFAGLGGGIGLLLTPWFVTLLLKSHDTLNTAQSTLDEGINLRILLFAIITIILTGIISGILPALQFSKIDLSAALKDDNVYIRQKRFAMRNVLVIAQIAPAIVVLVGAGLCIKSLNNLFAVETGFDSEHSVIASVALDDKKYDEPKELNLQRQLLDRLKSIPGVDTVSYGTMIPLSGSSCVGQFSLAGESNPLPADRMAFDCGQVGPDYHKAMGITIIKGRGFTQQDLSSGANVTIVNEDLARLLFRGGNPIGHKTSRGGDSPSTIIGVAKNVKHYNLTDKPIPHFDSLILKDQYSSYMSFIVRVKGGTSDIIPAVRREMLALDPTLETNRIYAMSQEVSRAAASTQMASIFVSVVGIAGLLLVAIGLYGITSFAVTRRTREIGVRMALGAQKYHVLKMIIEQGMLLVVIGVVTGLIGSYFAMRFLESMLFGVGKLDFSVYAISMLLLLVGGGVACWIPARRAANIDPMNAIRHDS